MSDDRPDEGAPRDPRPSGRIRIVGAQPATGEHPTVSPEPPEPEPTDDPNRFGAVPIISADEPPPADPTPPRGTPAAADEPPVRVVPDPEPTPPSRGEPDLDDLDLPPTAAVPVVEPDPAPPADPSPAPTAAPVAATPAPDDEDLDDIRVWAAPDDDDGLEIEAGRSASDDPFADVAGGDDDDLDALLGAAGEPAPMWGGGEPEPESAPAGPGPVAAEAPVEPATDDSDLPHWSEPAAPAEDDDAWAAVSGGPRWRGQGEESGEPEDFSDLLDETRVEPMGEDDMIFDDLDAEPGIPSAAGPPQRRKPYPDAPDDEEFPGGGGGGGRDMQQAVVVGVGLVALLLVCALIGPAALVTLATAIIVLATGELFTASRRGGYHPAVPVGLVGSGGMVLAAYWRGESAIPLMLFLVVVTTLCWWLFDAGPGDHALPNVGITVFGVMYVGGLGSFAALLLKFPDGVGMLIGAVLVAVAADVGGLFVGQRMGRSPLTAASPNKTLEGFFGGIVVAVVASTLLLGVVPGVFPWEFMDALILGVVGGVMTPLGDLCVSRLKRDLGVKDMGHLLPGHGGLLDRFDGLLFVLPATYYVVRLLEVYANVP